MKRIFLVVPIIEDLKYRKKWMKDSKTMSYNAGFDMDLKGYDKNTGTITKTDEEMINWRIIKRSHSCFAQRNTL